jgi:16S rRNA (guanine527-N7)-methyltransferase
LSRDLIRAAPSLREGSDDVGLRISEVAAQLAVRLDGLQVELLVGYLALIQKWNRVYNLTAVREPSQMLTHHIFDSLAVVAPLRNRLRASRRSGSLSSMERGQDLSVETESTTLLDVGSGAGLPGVVLAICCPELRVTCVDAVAKKIAFIQQVAVELKLSNLRSLHARVETMGKAGDGTSPQSDATYDIVCSRAFASLSDFALLTQGALAPSGHWMALKGKTPDEEIAALDDGLAEVFHVERLLVPELAADRCIVWMQKRGVL